MLRLDLDGLELQGLGIKPGSANFQQSSLTANSAFGASSPISSPGSSLAVFFLPLETCWRRSESENVHDRYIPHSLLHVGGNLCFSSLWSLQGSPL